MTKLVIIRIDAANLGGCARRAYPPYKRLNCLCLTVACKTLGYFEL